MSDYISLAEQSIREYFTKKQLMVPPAGLPASFLNKKAGVFVSLHKKSDHSLRGCIGTIAATQKNLAEEIIHNALAAAFDDPRFPPLQENELTDLEINVDVLSPPEPVTDLKSLDPKKFGLIVRNQRGQSGLLLPDIGVNTVAEQIAICCQKGGLSLTHDRLSFFRFTVERHH